MESKLNIHDYKDAPLFKSIIELNQAMIDADKDPITLNVVGGFALMIHDIRNKNEFTDIDFVGNRLPDDIEKISDQIGVKNGLEKRWINNDIMLSGSNFDDFVLSTGELHFAQAFDLEKIKVNVLDTQDLLRLKVIAIDTALSAVDFGGDFTRMKDFRDVINISKKLGVDIDSLGERFKDNIVNINTVPAIQTYIELGPSGIKEMVDRMQYEFQKMKFESKGEYKRTSFIDDVINKAIQRANEER
ncbi:MAG: hypothetical protein J5525_13410 [Lachnospiraceae bacterium]|nr:hypothetical protein [Lachnospiraceae bacterium]